MEHPQSTKSEFRYLSDDEFRRLSTDERLEYLKHAFEVTKQRIKGAAERSMPSFRPAAPEY